jgi:hypothetical protein
MFTLSASATVVSLLSILSLSADASPLDAHPRRETSPSPRDLNSPFSYFCLNFTQLCIAACASQKPPHCSGRNCPTKNKVSNKCDERGGYFYGISSQSFPARNIISDSSLQKDFACVCNDDDISTNILNQIASSQTTSGSITTLTTTKTATVSAPPNLGLSFRC